MSQSFKKTDRIAEMIQRKMAQIIQLELKDPRLTGILTISGATVTGDLRHAKVYFTVLNQEPEEVALILNSASRFLRTSLARTFKLRHVPALHFVYDESISYGAKLSRLIEEANADIQDENDESCD